MTARKRAAGLGLAVLLAACTLLPAGGAVAAGRRNTTLRVMMSMSGVDTLNPFVAFFNGALDIFGSIYPTLGTVDLAGRPGPYLATSWTVSPDRLTWTFHLRTGLKWTDGTAITADDAAWTMNLIMTDPDAATANGSLVADFASVTAPDPATLVIRTRTPQADVDYVSIPISGIPIVPRHIWVKHVAGLKGYRNDSYPIVGYGPWKLTAFKQQQYAKFDANKSFVLGAPRFDHLVEQIFTDTDSAVAALRSGRLDYISAMGPTQYLALEHDRSLRAIREHGNGWTSVELNPGARTRSGRPMGTGNPALRDPLVRQAIALATDRKTLVKKVLDGLGQTGAGYLPPAWPEWRWTPPPDETRRYDPAAANRLLDQAGYRRGPGGVRRDPKTGRALSLRLGIHSDDPRDAAVSAYLAGWLKQIGIRVIIQSLSMSTLNSDLAKGDWDMLMDGWTTGPDPTYLLGLQTCGALPLDNGSGGNTDAFYCDKDYDALFARQLTAFDVPQRAQTIGRMQEIIYRAAVNQLLYYYDTLDVVRKDTVAGGIIQGSPDSSGRYPSQPAFWSYLEATPTSGDASPAGRGLTGLGIGLLAAVTVGGVVAMRRRAGADDRE
jgi:peptide/nickel transport system substrate-binding protein